MSKCLVKFENSQLGYFYSGQNINGVVEVYLNKTLACRALQLTISGKAEFKWRNKNKESVKASEIYLKNVVFIFGNQDADPIDIETGFHAYRFSTTLPFEIPSSFECEFGKISYKAEAVFVLPWKMNYMKGKANFKVVSYVDLNIDPTLKIPFNTEISRKVRKLFFGYRTLFLKVYTPFTGIVPGHKIKLMFDINNSTKKNVRKMVIKLVQIVKLNSGGSTKNTRIIIAEKSAAGTPKKTVNQFESDITIPTNLVPVKHSNVICISYQIEVSAKLSSNVKKNPKFVIPIELGTVAINCERISRYSGILSLAPRNSFTRSLSLSSVPMTPCSTLLDDLKSPFPKNIAFTFDEA